MRQSKVILHGYMHIDFNKHSQGGIAYNLGRASCLEDMKREDRFYLLATPPIMPGPVEVNMHTRMYNGLDCRVGGQ